MSHSSGLRTSAVATLGLAAALVCVMPSPAQAANGTLPGGTSITNTIATPANNSTFYAPPGNVTVTGTATIGQGAPKADTTLIYVVDRSGSTQGAANCGGNQNGDSFSNSILDCEIAAAKALNAAAISAGTVDQVGVVSFGTTATNVVPLTSPANPAVNSGLSSIPITDFTNFEAAAQAACSMAQGSSNPNTTVVFLSDGFATTGGNALDDVPCGPKQATFQTFSIGTSSSCTDTGGGRGSLTQIAQETGGTCKHVTDPADLLDLVPAVIGSQLTKLEGRVDGGAFVGIPAALPKPGPTSVNYTWNVTGLTPGTHVLCTRASGTDAGGAGFVDDCRTVKVEALPKVSITDVTVTEGDAGTTPATFTVNLDKPAPGAASIAFATSNGSATAGPDYAAKNGTVSFAAGEQSKTVTVDVKGDLVDEPNETFDVNLSTPAGLLVADGKGVGTILDDDRSGTFSCRAAGLRVLGLEASVSNAPYSPCADEQATVLDLPLPPGTISVGADVVSTSTNQVPDDLTAVDPAVNDRGEADALVAGVNLLVGADRITADVVTSHAEARCTSSAVPTLTGSTQLTNLRVNGTPAVLIDGKATINLALATVYVNHTQKTAGSVTQRAIWVKGNGLLSAIEIVVGEARAGFTGNPCV